MKSLSARLLGLTVVFVMIAEVLIFVPSVARYRATFLTDRMEAAHLAVLVLEAAPDGMVSDEVTNEILDFTDAYSIASRRADLSLSLMREMPPPVDDSFDLRAEGPFIMIAEALTALTREEDRVIRVIGESPKDPGVVLELVMDEAPLVESVRGFAVRIFWLSLAISGLTAIMVFLVLRRQLVGPLKRITRHMVRFRAEPEDQSRVIKPSGRRDEVGIAERELAAMQTAIREALTQRRHLAALGTAVAKINHDLRGILSSALIVSDRLETSDDPEVRRVAPGLLDAIDRAVALCGRTLNYVGHDTPVLDLRDVVVRDVVGEAGFGLPNDARVVNDVAGGLRARADREQLFRVFNNLMRNAGEAGASTIRVTAERRGDGMVAIRVDDDGPGLPPRARENLFKPFEGSARAGGTGLGLSIARELAAGHGGDLVLESSDARGTVFVLTLPSDAAARDLAAE
jgi:signal transduction histidine kinase